MDEIQSFSMRVNPERKQFEVQLNLANGQTTASISPALAGELVLALVRSGAESGEYTLAQVAQPFVVEDVNFRLHQGQLVLVQALQGGFALTSNVDQQKLIDLHHQIEQLLAGAKPPIVQ